MSGITSSVAVKLIVELKDPRTAISINQALLPDNVDLPKGMSIEQRVNERFLEVKIVLEGNKPSIETLISTLDEFVSHILSVTQTLDRIGTIDDRREDPERKARGDKGES